MTTPDPTPRRGPVTPEAVITEEDLDRFDTSDGHAEETRADEPVNAALSVAGVVIAVVATAGIVLLVTTAVVLRYVFNSSLAIAAEGPTYLFPWLIAGGAIVAQARRGHIAVDVLVSRLHGRAHDRAQVAIWAAVTLLLAYLTYLAVYLAPVMAAQSTPIMGWPQLGSFGAFILLAACLAVQAGARTVHYVRHGAPHSHDGLEIAATPRKEARGV